MRILNSGLERFSASRLALCVLLALAATGALSTTSNADGGATHHVIVDMAYNALDKQHYPNLSVLLVAYPDAVDGGAYFPDFGYGTLCDAQSCKDYWAARANDAHDLRFQRPYLEQVRGLFRQPRSDDDRRTVMFLFGLIAHLEADNPWHFGRDSLPGFLDVAKRLDGNDETTVEVGADVFANFEYGEGGSADNWFLPLDAVRATYRAIGYDVAESPITLGWTELIVFHQAVKAWGWPSYWAYRLDLPWTHDNLLNYPVGGMQDGANHTARAWEKAWDELSTWRNFMPSMRRSSATSPAGGMQDSANPTANAAPQTADEVRSTGHSGESIAREMRLARQLLKEGAVKTHSRLENGNFYIDRVEIVNQQRVDELATQMLAEQPGARSR